MFFVLPEECCDDLSVLELGVMEEVLSYEVDELHLGGGQADGEVEMPLVTKEGQHLHLGEIHSLHRRGRAEGMSECPLIGGRWVEGGMKV